LFTARETGTAVDVDVAEPAVDVDEDRSVWVKAGARGGTGGTDAIGKDGEKMSGGEGVMLRDYEHRR
jgi:hypothetical protein